MPRSSTDDTQVRSLRGQIGQASQELATDENDVQRDDMESKALNFTDFCNSYCEPLYEVKGSLPKCPPGYKFNPKQMQCVPKTAKDDVGDSKGKDSKPQNGPGYNVWGNTGINGDGYAWAEKNAWGNDGGDAPEAVPYSS